MVTRNLALVGAGYWGKNLARNFHAMHVLHTLCDTSSSILGSYGQDFSTVAKSSDFKETLADPHIARVAIATPAATHFRLAKQALESGKDVYIEKPLCLEEKEAEELVRIATARDRILMVGHLLHYHPAIQKIVQLIGNGTLGKLYYITSNRLNLGKIRREENALWSFAPHDISVILSLVGEMPEAVECSGGSFITNGVADTTLTQLTFPGGVKSHVFVSWLNPFKEQKLTVVGSDAMVVFDDTNDWSEKLILYEDFLKWDRGNIPSPNKRKGVFVEIESSEPLRNECEHFVACCNQRTQPITDGKEGLRVLRVLQAAQHQLDANSALPSANDKCSHVRNFSAHPSAVVDDDAVVGFGTKIWHFSHICDGAEIGEHCNVGQNVFVASGVCIGCNVKIQNNVSIYTGTTIEDNVFLGPSCVLTNVSNPRAEVVRQSLYEKTCIRRGATIGANATIVCGTQVGQYAFVAAGAVVTSDVPDYALVVGVPGRVTGWMSRHGHRLHFNDAGIAKCPESLLTYRLTDGRVHCEEIDEAAGLPIEQCIGKAEYKSYKS